VYCLSGIATGSSHRAQDNMPGKPAFTGRITIRSEHPGFARLAAAALAPDNLSNMRTYSDESSATVVFEMDRMGSLIAAVDDYLMNAKSAREIIKLDKPSVKAPDGT